MNQAKLEEHEKYKSTYQHIIEKLDSFRNLASEYNLDAQVSRDLDTQQGILIINKKTGVNEEYQLLDLLKNDFDFEKNNIHEFRQIISENILNSDEVNKKVDEFYPLFIKHNINSFKIDNILYNRENELIYLEANFTYLDENRIIITVENISNYVQDKLILEQLALNNDILIKEVHHRVKNNLQILLSLMRIQESFNINSDKIIEYMKLSVSSMALIHNQLYSDDLNYISLKSLLEDYKLNIDNTYINRNITFNIKINKDLKISINKSNPILLILNELIINSIRYAWDENNKNKIIDCEFKVDSENLIIDYKNNGKYVENNDIGANSLEFILIESLVGQVDGSQEILPGENYHILIKIPMK